MSQRVGTIVFFLLLLVVIFGLLSFASEFFLGKPLAQLVWEYWFLFYRKT